MPAIALPLAPVVAPGLAQAATLAAGTAAYVAQQLYGFRAPLPPLPRTGGRAGQGTLGELVADAIAGARVGVASLPNPLGPEGSLGGIGLAALGGVLRELAQSWGYNNGPSRQTGEDPSDPNSSQWMTGSYNPGESAAISESITVEYKDRFQGCATTSFTVGSGAFVGPIQPFLSRRYYAGGGTTQCGGGKNRIFYEQTNLNGSKSITQATSTGDNPIVSWTATASLRPYGGGTGSVALTGAPYEERPWERPGSLQQADTGGTIPLPADPSAAAPSQLAPPAVNGTPVAAGGSSGTPAPVAPVPTPAYLPAAAPWVPSGSPGGGSGGQPRPSTTPGTFPTYNPSQPTQQTNPDGTVAPVAPAPTPTTDAGSVIPWPGAAPIPGTGVAPAATLTGIAQEVGRIERKLEVMNTPGEPGNMVDKFGDLGQLVGPLIEAIMALSSGTTYTLDSPCEVDDEGNKLPPVVVEAPGALTSFGAIVNRIDALAQLLQVHKDLKQPGCKHRPTGEWVTVQFEETTDVG